MSSPASLPKEITLSAQRGELQKVVKWLRKGGLVDALGSATTRGGRPTTDTLLLAATVHGQLEIVRELLKRGASVDLPTSFGRTALTRCRRCGRCTCSIHAARSGRLPDVVTDHMRSRQSDRHETNSTVVTECT